MNNESPATVAGAGTARRLLASALEATRGLKARAHVVVTIAASLYSTTLVTAILGFAFWTLAARLTTPEVVGRSAAVISAMQFIATFATLGLQTLLIAELPERDSHNVKRLVITSLCIAAGVSSAAAAGYAIVHELIAGAEWIYASPIGVVLFCAGTAVTTVTIVLDGAVVGVQQSGLQVMRNFAFSVVKLIGLPVAVLAVGMSPQVVFSVWMFGNIVSLLILAFRVKSPNQWLATPPSLRGFAPIWRTAAGHHWVNVATQAPRLALPVMVAAQVSDAANAGFYAALLLISFVWIIPTHLGTAMFALQRGVGEQFAHGLDITIRLSAAVSVLAAICTPFLARPLLSIFGPGYEQASGCLIAFATCTFAFAIKSIYIAVRRAQGALGVAARATSLGAVLELAAAEVGLKVLGVTGVGIGIGVAVIIEALFFWPAIRAARRQAIEAAETKPTMVVLTHQGSDTTLSERHESPLR